MSVCLSWRCAQSVATGNLPAVQPTLVAIAQQNLNGFQLCSTSLCCAQADQVGKTYFKYDTWNRAPHGRLLLKVLLPDVLLLPSRQCALQSAQLRMVCIFLSLQILQPAGCRMPERHTGSSPLMLQTLP